MMMENKKIAEKPSRSIREDTDIKSFWGAVAFFILLQMYGYCVIMAIPYFFFWAILFLPLQAEAIYHVREYLSRHDINQAIPSLHETEEFIKSILAIALISTYFIIRYILSPPQMELSTSITVFFFVISWVISYFGALIRPKIFPTNSLISTHKAPLSKYPPLVIFIVGLTWIAVGMFILGEGDPTVFYYHGLIGTTLCLFALSRLLIKKHLSKGPGKTTITIQRGEVRSKISELKTVWIVRLLIVILLLAVAYILR